MLTKVKTIEHRFIGSVLGRMFGNFRIVLQVKVMERAMKETVSVLSRFMQGIQK